MTSTTTREALTEFTSTMTSMSAMGQTLGISPCEALEAFFPAIVGNGDVMMALGTMMEPAYEEVGLAVISGGVEREAAEAFLHDVFHLLQAAAALGHMLGVHEAIGTVSELPTDLSDVDWDDLPDTFGDQGEA